VKLCSHGHPQKFFQGGQRYFAYLFQVVGDIGVGAGKFLGVQRIFARIYFPKPARKILQTKLPPNK